MAENWLTIRVELLGGGGVSCDPPPGRVMLVGPSHTFADLADAINVAFARWDHSHLHQFDLADDTSIGLPDEDAPEEQVDGTVTKVASTVGVDDEFMYTFDFGDDWIHRCIVEELVDPDQVYGGAPPAPVPVFGWGWIPDQYGRETAD